VRGNARILPRVVHGRTEGIARMLSMLSIGKSAAEFAQVPWFVAGGYRDSQLLQPAAISEDG
jgi:hypothetical protein